MELRLFDFTFPPQLIAQEPAKRRDESRLMVVDPQLQTCAHHTFKDLPQFFGQDDVLVFNDVKVFPSRLYGKTNGGRRAEVLLLDQISPDSWKCLVRPAHKLKDGISLNFSSELKGKLSGAGQNWIIEFKSMISGEETSPLQDLIAEVGFPPLPPYIKREATHQTKARDVERYQTVYAKTPGAAAAPTAGFHFTKTVKTALIAQGCELVYVTLHVGRDTFQPVRTEDITQHKMHGESYTISEAAAAKITEAKAAGKRITAVGTTSLRALESAVQTGGEPPTLRSGLGYTEKFIYPGYRFQMVDRLLTNFHQPKSTLLMLVSAFAGREFILECYQEAIREQYRLFSYGDAMLILNRGR